MEVFRTDDKLHSLMKRYKASNRPISVDFRKMVDWLKPDSYTHIIHPYPAKLLMHIPHFFLANNLLSPDGGRVLDPFCGSGTVLLEAKLSGRRVMGAIILPENWARD
ncbi:MAG: site-specific DNA-methyltransferase [Planctomycetes bacterium]|nr:site-specific DNA-methyltransferase [Planctomycetota bacterium]